MQSGIVGKVSRKTIMKRHAGDVVPALDEKHMACRKKYKAHILKYMPYIFCQNKKRIYRNLQNPSKKPFSRPFRPSPKCRVPVLGGDDGSE